MLSELSIKNFAIIDDISISFEEGLSVLTGETGAGKSIIIEAVNLLLGSRASADLVRSGCDQAELEAVFEIDPGSNAAKVLDSQGSDPSEGLMIRRLISSGGKSRVYVNSKRATLDLLKQVTQNLAGISSQHAHQGLLKTENHLEILDEFAQTTDLRQEVKQLYNTISPLKKKVASLLQNAGENKKEQDFLRFQIDEISDADLTQGEDERIEKKRKTLANAAQIFETVNGSVHELNDRDGSVVERLSYLRQNMERYSQTDERLEGIVNRVASVLFDLQDISGELRSFSDTLDLDPASLEAADQRLDQISKLKRKYGPSLDDVLQTLETLQAKLDEDGQVEERIAALEEEIQNFTGKIRAKASELSGLRKDAAGKISGLAARQLAALEMGRARFDVAFSVIPADGPGEIRTADGFRIGPDGMDKVGFLLSPNPGEAPKPLAKIASGGELSRIVLALKAVLSGSQSLETLIFDEVDAGIGGATSEKVGQKLKQLSEKHQVICITHLAQIAKYGTSQFRIFKTVEDGRTYTSIIPLNSEDARVKEIARMIGGAQITEATLAHARELLDQTAS